MRGQFANSFHVNEQQADAGGRMHSCTVVMMTMMEAAVSTDSGNQGAMRTGRPRI